MTNGIWMNICWELPSDSWANASARMTRIRAKPHRPHGHRPSYLWPQWNHGHDGTWRQHSVSPSSNLMQSKVSFFFCLNLPNATVIFFGYLTHRLSGLCSRKSKTKKKKNLFTCVKEEFICSQKKNQPPKNLVWLLFFFPPFFPLNLDLPIPPPHSHR